MNSSMKPVKLFYQAHCPHSLLALKCLAELQRHEPYASVPIEKIEELEQREYAARFDYYYVPTFYVGDEKVHEGHAELSDVRAVLDKALQ